MSNPKIVELSSASLRTSFSKNWLDGAENVYLEIIISYNLIALLIGVEMEIPFEFECLSIQLERKCKDRRLCTFYLHKYQDKRNH